MKKATKAIISGYASELVRLDREIVKTTHVRNGFNKGSRKWADAESWICTLYSHKIQITEKLLELSA